MIRSRIRSVAVTLFVGLPFLAACSAIDADMTRNMKSEGSDFHKALHMEYLELAVAENDEGDSEDAVYFNNKAISAAKGGKVLPQPLSERAIPAKAVNDLKAALWKLTDNLGNGWAASDPKNAARAQAMFDCWMQEQEEDTQQDHIKACRDGFEAAMGTFKMVEAKMPEPEMKIPGPFTVYFAFDSFDLSSLAQATIKKAAEMGMKAKVGSGVVTGHTDAAGASEYNIGLSRARAAAVRNALIENGMGRDQISQKFVGESEPAVKTEDGKREARNRRVVISFAK